MKKDQPKPVPASITTCLQFRDCCMYLRYARPHLKSLLSNRPEILPLMLLGNTSYWSHKSDFFAKGYFLPLWCNLKNISPTEIKDNLGLPFWKYLMSGWQCLIKWNIRYRYNMDFGRWGARYSSRNTQLLLFRVVPKKRNLYAWPIEPFVSKLLSKKIPEIYEY